jgi:glycerol uptake facilitator-like aquaporin
VALIPTLGPISGAHFNPVVTLTAAWQGDLPGAERAGYVAAQVDGALLGAAVAHLMFGEPLYSLA